MRLPRVGERQRCTLCGYTGRRFRAYNGRAGVECPRCGAFERHRLIWWYLTERLRIGHAPVSLLHLAPEAALADRLRATDGVDYVSGDLEPGAAMEVMDVTALPRPDASFDLVLVVHVLEHVPDDRAAMAELFRVLRPGGLALLQHPVEEDRPVTYEDPSITHPAARRAAFRQEDHVRIYGADVRERLAGAGFELEVVTWEEFRAAEPLAGAAGAGQNLYICRRPL